MRFRVGFIGVFAVLASVRLALAEPIPELAVDALADNLSHMSDAEVMDCAIVSNAMMKAFPQFKSQGETWSAVFLKRSPNEDVNVQKLKDGSDLLRSHNSATEKSGGDSEAQMNVMRDCMSKLIKATSRSVSKIASEHDLKVRSQK